ncbi:MAG: hypothetical protein WDZ36_01965 [Balneolaceae bacterium]
MDNDVLRGISMAFVNYRGESCIQVVVERFARKIMKADTAKCPAGNR